MRFSLLARYDSRIDADKDKNKSWGQCINAAVTQTPAME